MMDDKSILKQLMGNWEEDEHLLKPLEYILQVHGKNFRTKLAVAINHWLNIPLDKLIGIGQIINILHNGSLLIDDIQDESVLRRGIPVAHFIYSKRRVLNSVYFSFYRIVQRVHDLKHPESTKTFLEHLLELQRGQSIEVLWRDKFQCPTEDEYKQMAFQKTGRLFLLPIRLMQLFSDNKSDFKKFSELLGLYFQIRDDYCNLCSHEYTKTKSFCEDLTEGKFSFPIIYAKYSKHDDREIMHILRQRTSDVHLKRYCVSLLEKIGAFEHTRKVLTELDAEIRKEIAHLGGNEHIEKLLDELLNWKKET